MKYILDYKFIPRDKYILEGIGMEIDDDKFPHRFQEKGYTCGPTAIRIVLDALKYPETISADYIEKISNTNDKIGCIETGISSALDTLGIKYKRIVGIQEEKSMSLLSDYVKSGHMVLLRTLTNMIKHWIVIYDINNDIYSCSDPWLGKKKYSYEDIIDIWKPRNFDAFIILNKKIEDRPTIEKLTNRDIPECLDRVTTHFDSVYPKEECRKYLLEETDFSISFKLVINDKLIGCYLLAEHDLPYPEFEDKRGLEGICLYVDDEFRGLGYGKMMITHTENMGYDYVWGQQFKTIGNLEQWKKRRPIVYDWDNVWVTAKMLK